MTNTPLNPDALANLRLLADRATEEVRHAVIEPDILHKLLDFAVAQQVVTSVEANKALLREAMAMGWDDAIKAMQYPDGSPVEIMINQNPYRARQS